MYKKIYGVGVALTLVSSVAVAQQTAWQEINNAYKTGMELFERGKYSSAAKQFDRVEDLRTSRECRIPF